MRTTSIYLVYKGEVREFEVLKELAVSEGYLIDYNPIKAIVYESELDTPLRTSIHPKGHSVFSFDKATAIKVYNDYVTKIANELLDLVIKEEK